MDFLGKTCPVCSQNFHEGDDVVVCPKCGAPYHRDCYKQNGKCIFPELHKDGSFHFHFLCNASALKLVDSDTVIVKGHKKPIKNKTADRYGVPLDERRTVYNISDWSLGFTTAVKTYGSIEAVAHYIGKYITKSEGGKVGGRWYYSGGKLQRPVLTYQRVSFNDFDNYTYSFDCSGGRFKVVKYNGNTN